MNKNLRFTLSAATIAVAVMFSGCNDLTKEDTPSGETSHPGVSAEARTEVDSLFDKMTDNIETVTGENASMDLLMETEFQELAKDFEPHLSTGDIKANLGYAVAEMMALNKSTKLVALADSLDAYFSGFSSESPTSSDVTITRNSSNSERGTHIRGIASGLFAKRNKEQNISRSYQNNGVNGLATSLLAKTPEMMLSRSEVPSWPQFVTVSYIQDVIDNEITPRLTNVLNALEYIETAGDNNSATVIVDGDEVRIDVADVLILDASIRALRSSLNLFTAYNWDIYEPTKKDYSWIDTLMTLEDNYVRNDQRVYSLSDDTLITTYVYKADTAMCNYSYDLLKYNMERSDFCTIRKSNHEISYNDMKAIPVKLRKALDLLKANKESQENDLLKYSQIYDEMAGLEDELILEGLSHEFASNFNSPHSVVDFFEKLITEPYRFNENLSGIDVDITVDLGKFYTNPIQDLRDMLPLYAFEAKENSIVEGTGNSYSYGSSSWDGSLITSFGVYAYDNEEVVIDIPESEIISESTDESGYTYITLANGYRSTHSREIDEYLQPVYFTNDQGKKITFDEMEVMLEETGEVPYFKDYTFNGIFPDMTRAKWNAQLKNAIANW